MEIKSTVQMPAVNYIDHLIQEAIVRGASDIHLEPTERNLRVRFRIDGDLYDQQPIDKSIMHQLISRLKVLARVNLAEKRVPQDGKFLFHEGTSTVDIRLSSFPSLFGEKLVIRILDRSFHMMALEQLGLLPQVQKKFESILQKPQGLLLVTGPTGSGKTTTLYAALSHLHIGTRNIVTLEDPVEYNIEGITQGQIHPDAGFTFETGLRALLRQDPDILMVGEIRDRQTARIAIEAALTGHLVLSTLHTNDAASTIVRFLDMGIEPYLLNSSLIGVMAQRLVRKNCVHCLEDEPIDPTTLQKYQINRAQKGRGCVLCQDRGFKGRTGLFELLTVTDNLRQLIVKDPSIIELKKCAQADGIITLQQDATEKANSGLFSFEEYLRIIH